MTSQNSVQSNNNNSGVQGARPGIQQNIGMIDRYVRLTAGMFLVGSALSARRSSIGSRAMLAIGSMSMTEGILGWCPMMHLMGIRDMNGTVGNETKSNQRTTDSDKKSPSDDPSHQSESDHQMATTKQHSDEATANINHSFQ